MKPHIKAYLLISLDRIIVLAPIIPRFKGLGMRNLQYWIRICQKSHNTVTNHNYILCVVRIFMKPTLHTWTSSEECLSKDHKSRTPSCLLILSKASLLLAHSPKALLTLTRSSGPLVFISRIRGTSPSSVFIRSMLASVCDNSAMAPTTKERIFNKKMRVPMYQSCKK